MKSKGIVLISLCAFLFAFIACNNNKSELNTDSESEIIDPIEVKFPSGFLYGASVYPEQLTLEEQINMLEEFSNAHMNMVRVGDFAWPNVETSENKFDFGWLEQFLDELHKKNMKAILVTGTSNPPQWLYTKHPEILSDYSFQNVAINSNKFYRYAVSFNHPVYEEYYTRYITKLVEKFKDHPAIIGWQLNNETGWHAIGFGAIDKNPENNKQWLKWLEKEYKTPEQFNERLGLIEWGKRISSFEEVPVSSCEYNPLLQIAHYHYRKDVLFGLLKKQYKLLRSLGVDEFITTNWQASFRDPVEDHEATKCLDISGLNVYLPKNKKTHKTWEVYSSVMDNCRSSHNINNFYALETSIGAMGGTKIANHFKNEQEFKLHMIYPVAFGSGALIFWSGNRWHSGDWPHWGGVLDWTNKPEPDIEWVKNNGEFLNKWGDYLLKNPVKTSVAIYNDYDQRISKVIIPHIDGSNKIAENFVDMGHRLGLGVEYINRQKLSDEKFLEKFDLVVIPAATVLDSSNATASLLNYCKNGGNVIISPLTSYQTWDGLFRSNGFGANMKELTGMIVRSTRKMGDGEKVKWAFDDTINAESNVESGGLCELFSITGDVDTIAKFVSEEPILNGKPAAIRKRNGQGSVVKLGFNSFDSNLVDLFSSFIKSEKLPFEEILPKGVHAVPRTDGSVFLMNTTYEEHTITIKNPMKDRISEKTFQKQIVLKKWDVIWLEKM